MTYIENPKTKGSGIVCCIPQSGRCPYECPECFFQSGRGYLQESDLPNMPDKVEPWQVVRVNDGNDSHHRQKHVINMTEKYPLRFYNTSVPHDLEGYKEPVVLTVNSGKRVDDNWTCLHVIPDNVMFVRILTNTWNLTEVVYPAVCHYVSAGVPIVLTFMAYHHGKDVKDPAAYTFRTRTSNPYWAIKRQYWKDIMNEFEHDQLVYSCANEGLVSACTHCGNCLREFHTTKERI